MQSYRSVIVSFAVFLALFRPATCLVHGPADPPHWYETREYKPPILQNPSPMPPLLIDTFQDPLHNDLGFWHGTGENLSTHHGPGFMRLFPTDPDQNFHTQFDTNACFSLAPWQDQYLHVVFEGNEEFSVSLNGHNAECYPHRSPFPGVPDSVQASRYLMRTQAGGYQDEKIDWDSLNASNTSRKHPRPQPKQPSKHSCEVDGDDDGDEDERGPASPERTELYIPLSHFHVDLRRVVSVSFMGFYTNEPISLYRVEIVPTVPPPSTKNNYFVIPEKAPSGSLVLRCSLPNSFAFGIDDGQPRYAQEVLRILDEEDVRVTFFVVGAGLSDPTTNFTNFYREMLSKGHQVALHSNTHPKYVFRSIRPVLVLTMICRMEGLPTMQKIDEEITRAVDVFKDRLNIQCKPLDSSV